MARKKLEPAEYFSECFGQFLEGGDENSQGYVAIVVFGILAVFLIAVFLGYIPEPSGGSW